MNKKNLLSVAFLLLVGSTAVECYGQQQPVSLEVKKIDDSPIHHGFPKMPVQIPLIYQDDHLCRQRCNDIEATRACNYQERKSNKFKSGSRNNKERF